ncbi:MAG: hypothetical protein J6I76_17750 [Oribacterium sp.]|nr:hypothetical protein [Oribacterium sp.]
MEIILNYKSYYEAFVLGVVDSGYTAVAKLLFFPLFKPHTVVNDDGVPFEAESTIAARWAHGYIPIHENIRKAAAKNESLKLYIDYFKNTIVPKELSEATTDEMLDAMVELVNNCDLRPNKKKQFLKYYNDGEIGEFLARVFQRALLGNNHVASANTGISAADDNSDAMREFDELVIKKKPELFFPHNIRKNETFVNQLYAAYEKKTGRKVRKRNDVSRVGYEEHFDTQRKWYYYAETIHREIRDSMKRKEEDCFKNLKNEVEAGIYHVSHKPYDDPVDRIDKVTERACDVNVSPSTQQELFNWIGPPELMGVCHMLVNDERLKWVEDDENAQSV